MKVLWVYFDIGTGNQMHYNHGVGAIDAVIRKGGHDTSLAYYREAPSRDEVRRDIREHSPDLLFFPVNTHQWMFARQYADWAKEDFDLMTVVGGIHAILSPEEVIAHPTVDAVATGEGEYAALELLDNLRDGRPVGGIEGLYVRSPSGKVQRNPFRHLIENLDELPISRREIWDYTSILLDSCYEMVFMGGRGCPFRCNYCANSARREKYKGHGKFVRMCSPEKLIEMIEVAEQDYNFDRLFIEDDVFIFKHSWTRKFCELYKKRFSYGFRAYVRVEFCTREILEVMKDAGCYQILVGVEAGNERMRHEILNRKMNNEDIVRVFRWADEVGLKTWNFNMFGFPDETEQTVQDLFDLNRKIRPNKAQVSIFYPYPSTELYRICEERGYLTRNEQASYFENTTIKLPTISHEKLQDAFWKFRYLSLQIRAEKDAKGYLDFSTLLEQAEIRAENEENVKLALFKINGWEDITLFEHPRAQVRFRVDVKPDTFFRTSISLDPHCIGWGGRGVRFLLTVRNGSRARVLVDRYLDPKQDPSQRRWHHVQEDISDLAGREVEFEFVTEPDPSGDLRGAWGGWMRPHLVQKDKRGTQA